MQEKEKPSIEVAEVIGGCWGNGIYSATVLYKGELFGIKEANEKQLLESIRIAVDKRNEVNE
jgi:hypothetical protein